MTQGTMIVPPTYEVLLFGQGYDAAMITARTVRLMKQGQEGPKVTYTKFEAVEQMSFAELVQFVLNKIKGQ